VRGSSSDCGDRLAVHGEAPRRCDAFGGDGRVDLWPKAGGDRGDPTVEEGGGRCFRGNLQHCNLRTVLLEEEGDARETRWSGGLRRSDVDGLSSAAVARRREEAGGGARL
jgi:hypothetical protein